MKKLFIGIGLMISLALSAQISTMPLTDTLPAEAIGYNLPKTALRIKVKTKVTTLTPGKYARYAERYLSISNVITTESTQHEIISVDVSTYTLPDPENSFYIQTLPCPTSSKETANSPTNVYLTPSGILQAVGISPSRKTPSDNRKQAPQKQPATSHATQDVFLPQLAIYTQEMQLASSSMREAELASKQIFALRETRIALMQGEVNNMPKDGEALALYLKSLDKMERSYTELFTGTKEEKVFTKYFDITPNNIPCYEVLFRFSHQKGIVDKEDLSGAPIYFLVHNREDKSISQAVDSVSVISDKSSKKKGTISAEKRPANISLYYYYPHLSEISILNGQQELYKGKFNIAQFGDLMRLISDQPIQVELNPETGGIIRRTF